MADTIKEFLVSLGFKVDETTFRNFKDGVSISSADVAKLGLAATGTAVAVAAAVVKISREYENLYWASQRTGATVANLQAVSYAASQIGLSAEQGKGAIEGMAASMRMNPGLQGLAAAYGANAKDPVERIQQLIGGMKKAFGPDGYFAAAMQASNFGISEPVFFQMWTNIDKMKDETDDYKKRAKEAGLNTEELAKSSNELQTELRRLGSDMGIFGDKMYGGIVSPAKDAVIWFDKLVQEFNKLSATASKPSNHGWSWLSDMVAAALPEDRRKEYLKGLKERAEAWRDPSRDPLEPRVAVLPKSMLRRSAGGGVSSGGISANDLDTIRMIESGGRPNVQTGRYKGAFQLSDEEFQKYGGGNIWDAGDNRRAATAKLEEQKAAFRRRHDRNPTLSELYLMHQQGEGGAEAHMAHPERPAWMNMYSTAEGRKKGPAWARKAIWGNVPNDMKGRYGGASSITSQEFMDLWGDKVNRFSARLGGGPGWGAQTVPAASEPEGSAGNSIAQHNNLAIHINGITDPEGLRGAMTGAADEMTRHLMIRMDAVR